VKKLIITAVVVGVVLAAVVWKLRQTVWEMPEDELFREDD
jgi:multisubunit Na+/H+ antiporter MnhC subunit